MGGWCFLLKHDYKTRLRTWRHRRMYSKVVSLLWMPCVELYVLLYTVTTYIVYYV